MIQEQAAVKKRRRVPKPGTGFGILRVIGIILEVVGIVIMVASLVGFIIMLIKTAPVLFPALTHLEQQMAGFVMILLLVWLFLPVFTGLFGLLMAVVGFVFYRLATQPGTAPHA